MIKLMNKKAESRNLRQKNLTRKKFQLRRPFVHRTDFLSFSFYLTTQMLPSSILSSTFDFGFQLSFDSSVSFLVVC